MWSGDKAGACQSVVAESSRHGQHSTQSIIKYDAAAAFYSSILPRVVTFVIDAEAFGCAALGEDGSCVAYVGHVEHVCGALLADNCDAGRRAAPIAIEQAQLAINLIEYVC